MPALHELRFRSSSLVELRRLDEFCQTLEFLYLTQTALFRAAELWAHARKKGRQTASDLALDADMILCAQTQLLKDPAAIIVTTNLRHLTRFTPAASHNVSILS